MYPVVRLFENRQQAHDAVNALREEGFDAVRVAAPPAPAAPQGDPGYGAPAPSSSSGADAGEAAAAALLAGHALRAHPNHITTKQLEFCADSLRNGRSMVVVEAPFGRSRAAEDVLARYHPVDTDHLTPKPEPMRQWDEYAPLSSALGLPTISHKADPVSDFLGIPTKTKDNFTWMHDTFGSTNNFSLSRMIGISELKKPKANWQRSFGLPLLSKPKANWNRSFGLPLLSKPKANWERSFGFPMLTKPKKNWTHSFGLPLLKKD